MPEPEPMSKNDWHVPIFRRRAISRRQNAVVGCWPVPKLKPGSSTTTDWFFRGLRLEQLGLSSSASLISMGLKWRFHDSAQSSRRILAVVILQGPTFNPHPWIRASPAVIVLRTSAAGLEIG